MTLWHLRLQDDDLSVMCVMLARTFRLNFHLSSGHSHAACKTYKNGSCGVAGIIRCLDGWAKLVKDAKDELARAVAHSRKAPQQLHRRMFQAWFDFTKPLVMQRKAKVWTVLLLCLI